MQKNRKITLITTLLVILAIVVFVNLIFNRLNLSVDLTETELYSISDEARRIAGETEKETEVYCFVEDENKTSVIGEITGNFCKTSDKLNFKAVNPVEHPELTQKYTADGNEVTVNTVVFDNGKNYKIIPYEEMLSYNYLTGQNNLLVAEEKFCQALNSLNRILKRLYFEK